MDKKNAILVCTHIPFILYANDFYKLIQAGAVNKPSFGIIRDDEGDNISNKNPYYSELTTLYWGWKHLDYDFLGLVHYRRYFRGHLRISADEKTVHVISEEECKDILTKYDIIVPKKRHYVIETLYDHYCRTLRPEPLQAVEDVFKERYPDYLKEFSALRIRRSAHMFNMMIANKSFLDRYLPWLFEILDVTYNKLDMSSWTDYEKRGLGSIAELLLDIYIQHNNIKYKEARYLELIAFARLRKGINYLIAKFFGKRYRKSVR